MRDVLAGFPTDHLLSSTRSVANPTEGRRDRASRQMREESPMKHRAPLLPSGGLAIASSVVMLGCSPTVDIGGVYFPGWLVSTTIGIVVAYGIVSVLARSEASRELADSGLFFVGLIALIALSTWWLFFRGF